MVFKIHARICIMSKEDPTQCTTCGVHIYVCQFYLSNTSLLSTDKQQLPEEIIFMSQKLLLFVIRTRQDDQQARLKTH